MHEDMAPPDTNLRERLAGWTEGKASNFNQLFAGDALHLFM